MRFEEAAAEEANYRVSFAHIRSALGFTPRHSLADGIAEVKAAVERGLVGNYTDAKYSNFKAMTSGQAARARSQVVSRQRALSAFVELAG